MHHKLNGSILSFPGGGRWRQIASATALRKRDRQHTENARGSGIISTAALTRACGYRALKSDATPIGKTDSADSFSSSHAGCHPTQTLIVSRVIQPPQVCRCNAPGPQYWVTYKHQQTLLNPPS